MLKSFAWVEGSYGCDCKRWQPNIKRKPLKCDQTVPFPFSTLSIFWFCRADPLFHCLLRCHPKLQLFLLHLIIIKREAAVRLWLIFKGISLTYLALGPVHLRWASLLSGLAHLGGMFLSFRSYDIFYPTKMGWFSAENGIPFDVVSNFRSMF